jgi:malate synthase
MSSVHGLTIDPILKSFVEQEALKGLNIPADQFWRGVADILARFAPRCADLLADRDRLQESIDLWHRTRGAGAAIDAAEYKAFLHTIGYLQPAPPKFACDTTNVDAEIATIAGPQLVVPISNARYALNAVNARWGSLYDAFYGTDAISEEQGRSRSGPYNPVRGAAVVARAKEYAIVFIFPLSRLSD